MPARCAMADMATDIGPCSAMSAAVASRTESVTCRRWVSMVSAQILRTAFLAVLLVERRAVARSSDMKRGGRRIDSSATKCIVRRRGRAASTVEGGEEGPRGWRLAAYGVDAAASRGRGAAVIEVRSLTKTFGQQRAVERLSFSAPAGHVTGFLGPNGAGKTTTLRCLLGLASPTSGTA